MGRISAVSFNGNSGHQTRRALSLIELVVVIAIIGLLAALLLTAIQSARETGRRAVCAANLHQMGVATAAYYDVNGYFPPGTGGGTTSLHVALLPYLEQQALATDIRSLIVSSSNPGSRVTDPIPAEMHAEVPIYACPSDPAADLLQHPESDRLDVKTPGTNYHGNFGSGVQKYGHNGVHVNLVFASRVSSGDITDGLSNTAAISEALVGDASGHLLTTKWYTIKAIGGADELDLFAESCLDPAFRKPKGDTWGRGRPWLHGEASVTLYNHVLPPNRPACVNGQMLQLGAYPPSSNHPGGVNLLFADGHQTFVSDQIAWSPWRMLGSRAED